MADITAELLAQLEHDTTEWRGTFSHVRIDAEYAHAKIMFTAPDGESWTVADLSSGEIAEEFSRMLNALPALVVAVKERDQLRAQLDNTTKLYVSHRNYAATVATALEIDGWENGWPDVAPRIQHMRAERDRLRADLASEKQVTEIVMLSELAELREEATEWRANNDRLRAEREQVRTILGATPAEGQKEAAERVAGEAKSLREAAHLRTHAALEAWSGAACGLDEAALLAAKAESLEKLSGISEPTVEQQRDAAFAKVAALTVERNRLRVEVGQLLDAKPLLVHVDSDGESLCGMETHWGIVPLTAERSKVTCVGCWILSMRQSDQDLEKLRGEASQLRADLRAVKRQQR